MKLDLDVVLHIVLSLLFSKVLISPTHILSSLIFYDSYSLLSYSMTHTLFSHIL